MAVQPTNMQERTVLVCMMAPAVASAYRSEENYVFQHVNELPSDKFPILHPIDSSTPCSFQQTFSYVDIQHLKKNCHATLGVEVETVLQAAWGILLQGYMLSKHIHFGYRCIGTSTAPVDFKIDENHTCPFDKALICRVASRDGDSFAALVSRQQNEPYLLKSSMHPVNPEAIDTLLLIQYSSPYDPRHRS